MSAQGLELGLRRPVDPARDHVRTSGAVGDAVTVLIYGDYLCPYCRRLGEVLGRLRHAMGERLMYAFRQFPNERAHPGATFASRAAEAAGLQDRFWPMHDALYTLEPPLTEDHVIEAARRVGLDMERFSRDVADPAIAERARKEKA